MNKNKHLLLFSSLGVFGLLVYAAVEENFLRQWRSIQRDVQTENGPVEVRLRQIVVPELRVTDRCVTCHVGMAPGEMDLAGSPLAAAHPPVYHEIAEFGCTACHSGQGHATEQADAHGEVSHWPHPMIPLHYAEAGCGTCHTHIQVPNQTQLTLGQRLIERYDCLACHAMDGRGGTLRPGIAEGDKGPDLTPIGAAGYDSDWYEQHLAEHLAAADGAWHSCFGPIDPADRTAIEAYLDSRVGAPRLVEAKALFHSLGCRGCHKIGGVGGDDGPDLTLVGQTDPALLDYSGVRGERTLVNWLVEHFREPDRVVPGSLMPDMGLTEEQIDLLTFYMLSLRRSVFPEAYWPKDRIRAERFGEREFATDGHTLYETFCAACHGDRGQGLRYPGLPLFPAVGNPDLFAVASDDFLVETIRLGRPGRRMPGFGKDRGGLRDDEIRRIVEYLREQSGVATPDVSPEPQRRVAADAMAGQQLYAAHCAGCHGAEGASDDAPALNNPGLLSIASDSFLVETISRGRRGTPMNGFAKSSPIHPTLSEEEIQSIVAFIRTWEESSP